MTAKYLSENPTIADQVIFELKTPDADGCFADDPYKVDEVKIYYIQRSYGGTNYSQYNKKIYDETLKAQLDEAIELACASPTDENLAEVEKLRTQLDVSATTETFYYSNAEVVAVFGNDDTPAWLAATPESPDNSLVNIDEDVDGNAQYGHFELTWSPDGMREGDYFICWTWTPLLAGDSLCDSMQFTLSGSTLITTSIPTHFTNPEKYQILSERYLPEMFKLHLSNTDLTPEVLQEFNAAISKGFTFVEDLANQIIDLIDANAVHESLLPLLGNLFNIQLKSTDPTLWRRQIKNAVPLYKKKGTYGGLVEALNQIGVKLGRFAQLWQVISKYTYQEAFIVGNSDAFVLSRTALLPVDTNNFELYKRNVNSDTWTTLDATYVSLENDADDVTTMTWTHSSSLSVGDELRVVYEVVNVPNSSEQTIEDYVRALPLADQRDEQDQEYPLKNWNVRVIEDDDPLLDTVLVDKHQYHSPLIYGQVRTEFPYSENIYNMDEYNGSIRDSSNPCDIGKDFLDGCSGCIGSKFVVDLEIDNISHDRILEATNVIQEYVPFHAVLHSMNLSGTMDDLVMPPLESFDILINVKGNEFTVAGGQTIFNRTMQEGAEFKRNELANMTTAVSSGSATAYNENVILFSPDARLDTLPIDPDSTYTYLEVLAPSSNAGEYGVENAYRNHISIVSGSPTEPLDQSAFTFRLSNERASKATATIYQDDLFKFSDSAFSFWAESIKTQWDVDNDVSYTGDPWVVNIPAYADEYEILNILSDGTLVLADPSKTLPTSNTSGITYTLKDDSANIINSGSTGSLTVSRRGRVDLGSSVSIRGSTVTFSNTEDFFDSYHEYGQNHYVKYGGTQYAFNGLVPDSTSQFYISGYTGGDVVGSASIEIYQRLVNNKKGYFHYTGLKIVTSVDHEVGLQINNGDNADSLYPAVDSGGSPYTLQLENDKYKESFLVLIGTDYYAISRIDGANIWLSGPDKEWLTTGTAISYDILQYIKQDFSVEERDYPPMPGHDFSFIDRRSEDITSYTTETEVPIEALSASAEEPAPEEELTELTALAAALNSSKKGESLEMINQKEAITFSIKVR